MNQHRPVLLLEHVLPNLDHIIRTNAERVGVKGSMVQFAESNSVLHIRNAIT